LRSSRFQQSPSQFILDLRVRQMRRSLSGNDQNVFCGSNLAPIRPESFSEKAL
jgi:hypothetical protein